MGKADYVRAQGQTRPHHCHWPGCPKQVPPAMWALPWLILIAAVAVLGLLFGWWGP